MAAALYKFLFVLFAIDKQGKELCPPDAKRCKTCNTGWKGFFIREGELQSLTLAVATEYLENRAHLG